MTERLETVYTADTRGFDRGASRVDRRLANLERGMVGRLDRIDRRWERSARSVDLVGRAVGRLAIAGGLTAFGRTALDVARQFEAAMNRVRAVSGATERDMAALADEAKRLGRETAFSASEAAAAIETLVRNGVSITAVLGGALDASLRLASATGGDLARSADLATDVMAQFGFEASELGQVVDKIVGAVVNSKFGFDDLALAIGQGGAVAAQAGVDFDDFVASLAATAQAFSSGSDAGTSFKTFITRLSGDSKQARAEIARLGLEFFDAAGNLRPMREIAGELQRALAGLSDEARTSSLKTIFGTDAIRTAATLAEQGAEGFDRLAASIARISAADQAEARMAGLEGAMKRLAAAWEGFLLALGDGGGLSGATVAAEALANALGFVTENLDLVLAATLAYAGSRGIGALVASVNAQRAATAQLVAQRETELRQANTAALAARQELARRVATVETLNREGASRAALASANRALAGARAADAAATQAQVAATGALAAATTRLSVAQTIAVRTAGALRGVMAFFGGPIGLAITALSLGIYAIGTASDDAGTSVEALDARLSDMASTITRIRELDRQLADDTAKLEVANRTLEDAIRAQGQAAVDTARLEIDAVGRRIAASKALRREYVLQARDRLAKIEEDLTIAKGQFRSRARADVVGDLIRNDPEFRKQINEAGRSREGVAGFLNSADVQRRLAAGVDARFARIEAEIEAGVLLSDADRNALSERVKISELEIRKAAELDRLTALTDPGPDVPAAGGAGSGRGGAGAGGGADDGAGGGGGRAGRPAVVRDLFAGSEDRLRALEAERIAIGKTGAELAFLEERQRLLEEARREGVELTPQVLTQLESQAAVYAATSSSVDDLRAAEELLRRTSEENLTVEEKRAQMAERLEALRPALIQLAGSEAVAQAAINAELERTDRLLSDVGRTGRDAGDDLVDAITEFAEGLGNANEAGKRLLFTLAKIAADQLLKPALTTAFSFVGTALGFDTGGWTGGGGRGDVAGVTHGQEFVVRAPFAARFRPFLEAMNKGRLPGFASGGMVGALPAMALPSPQVPRIDAAPGVALYSNTEIHLHGTDTNNPEAVLAALRPELDRRDRKNVADAQRAVARRNRNDPGYLD